MSIFYNKIELFKLFESNPTILDDISEIYRYSYKNDFGYTLSLFFSTYENIVILILEHENFSNTICNFFIKDIDRIVVNSDFKYLLIFKEDKVQPDIKCNFLPNFSIEGSIY